MSAERQSSRTSFCPAAIEEERELGRFDRAVGEARHDAVEAARLLVRVVVERNNEVLALARLAVAREEEDAERFARKRGSEFGQRLVDTSGGGVLIIHARDLVATTAQHLHAEQKLRRRTTTEPPHIGRRVAVVHGVAERTHFHFVRADADNQRTTIEILYKQDIRRDRTCPSHLVFLHGCQLLQLDLFALLPFALRLLLLQSALLLALFVLQLALLFSLLILLQSRRPTRILLCSQ